MPSTDLPPNKPLVSAAVLGIGCCALAAVSYTASNACLKQLSTLREVDPAWTTCIKESTAFLFAAGCMLVKFLRKTPLALPAKEVGILIAVGVAVQMIGNLGLLWGMGKVGLAVTIPASSGTQLLICALGGWFLFRERLTLRSTLALGLLAIALTLLGFGAEAAGKKLSTADSPLLPATIVLAVAASCFAGITFASLSIAMRRSSNLSIPQSSLLFIIAGMGVVTMWPLSFYRMGSDAMLATASSKAFLWMLSASLFNLIGFFGFAKGLQLTSVVHASVLNASQVAMSAVVAMIYFNESRNVWLTLGIVITIIGIVLIDSPRASDTVEVMV